MSSYNLFFKVALKTSKYSFPAIKNMHFPAIYNLAMCKESFIFYTACPQGSLVSLRSPKTFYSKLDLPVCMHEWCLCPDLCLLILGYMSKNHVFNFVTMFESQ